MPGRLGSLRPVRAAVIDRFGPAGAIEVRDVPPPAPGPDDVLVRVTHGSVNHVDTFVRSGAWRTPLAFPFVVGRDAVGTVVACGAAAAGTWSVGDVVWTSSLGHDGRDGALAEHVCVPRARLYRVPPGVAPAELAALSHPGTTGWLALFRHGRLRAGQRVLVVGGGGNVGWAAVHLAVHAGATVLATAREEDHADLRTAGATPLDVREDLTVDALGGGVDLVVDAAGANDLERYVGVLRHGGRIVLLAGLRATATLPVGRLYLTGATVTGFTISQASVEDLAEAARHLADAVVHTGLRPRRVVVVPLDGVADAHHRLETGHVRGKVVVDVAARPAPGPDVPAH